MKYFLVIFTAILIVGCDAGVINAPDEDIKLIDVESIEDIGYIAKKIEDNFSIEELDGNMRNKSSMGNRESEILKDVLLPLQRKGSAFKEKVLENSVDKDSDLEYLNKITEEELIMVGLLSVILENADELENKCKSIEANPLMAQSIDGDRVMSCLGTATGYSSIKAIADINGLMSARTLIEGFAKPPEFVSF
ncbi:hypothetical protein [Rhodohalobacter halophilus]|uniref:hypothetical protein n=1 Tax=Rhodohalobacter halophilus TaxID=1812810 RepID=UPI00083FD365|nr:hypothetical protein [Rhodohalobacter halophilus]